MSEMLSGGCSHQLQRMIMAQNLPSDEPRNLEACPTRRIIQNPVYLVEAVNQYVKEGEIGGAMVQI